MKKLTPAEPKTISRAAWFKAFTNDPWWKNAPAEAKACSLVLNAFLDFRSGRLTKRSTQSLVNRAFQFSWSSALCELNRQIERYPELEVFKG